MLMTSEIFQVPPLTERIEDTDVTWMDLTLAYLWWPDGKTVGEEEVRGRACWVLDVPAPTNHFGAASRPRQQKTIGPGQG